MYVVSNSGRSELIIQVLNSGRHSGSMSELLLGA